MAAIIPSLSYLIRAAGNASAAADYTCCFWAKRTNTIAGADYREYFIQMDTGYTEWAGLFTGSGGEDLQLNASDGGAPVLDDNGEVQLNEWQPYSYRRTGTLHEMLFGGIVILSITLDTSTNVIDEQRLNYDGFSLGAAQYMYLREWNTALTDAELIAEWNSPTVIKTTNLWSNCPLLTDANDISGNARHYTATGSVTWATGPTPVPLTNTTSGTAYDITGTLPQERVQVVNDGTTTQTVWFKRTATIADGNELGFFGWGGEVVIGGYFPQINPYLSPDFVSSILGIGGLDRPIQIPVTTGNDYYFRLFKTSYTSVVANPVPAVLYTKLSAAPITAPVTGDIYVNDDTAGFPAVVLSGITDYLVKRFYHDIPAGEQGDIASNGNFLLEDTFTKELKLFDINSNLLVTIPGFSIRTPPYAIRLNRASDAFYVVDRNSTPTGDERILKKISNLGTIVSSVTMTGVTGTVDGIAANEAETILYHTSHSTGTAISQWSISGSTPLADLVAGIAGYFVYDLLVLEDNSIVAIYYRNSPKDAFVRRFDASGATLNTYSLSPYIDYPWTSFSPRIAYALDSPNSFWVYIQRANGRGYIRFLNIKSSDGSILTNRNHLAFEFGIMPISATYEFEFPGNFGASESCPFFILPSSATNSINVIKITVPSSNTQEFDYTTTGGLSPSTFSLQHGENQSYSGLANGTYGITETPVDDWTTEYEVSNGDPHDAIDLAGGENVTVTVTNTFVGINPLSGIYKIIPNSFKTNDTVYTSVDPEITEDVAIPRPTFRTGLIGK